MVKKMLSRLLQIIALLLAMGTSQGIDAGQNVIVVLDDSGSMRQQMRTEDGRISRIQAAKNALSKVVQGLPDDAQLGILLLNNGGRGNTWLIPLGPLSATAALPKIAQIRADGGTPLGSQMKIAADALLELRRKQFYGDYRLLVITDGEATDANLLEAYLPDIMSRGLSLDVIGVDMAANHSLAGRAHSYRRADDARSFEKALADVFAESSSQTDEQGASDFELIAGLPDELAQQALSAFAAPRNSSIAVLSSPAPMPNSPMIPPAGNTPIAAVPTNPTSATDSFVGFLSALPCFFAIIILFMLMVSISQKKRRK